MATNRRTSSNAALTELSEASNEAIGSAIEIDQVARAVQQALPGLRRRHRLARLATTRQGLVPRRSRLVEEAFGFVGSFLVADGA